MRSLIHALTRLFGNNTALLFTTVFGDNDRAIVQRAKDNLVLALVTRDLDGNYDVTIRMKFKGEYQMMQVLSGASDLAMAKRVIESAHGFPMKAKFNKRWSPIRLNEIGRMKLAEA